ncbi:hypothetical protein AB1285_25605 [Microbacterium sp. NRRL B-14842]|uniref:hypothetical protein n=1 Tax=Microbacterium sp. NRRL B-14842 TaxID=3162881 RepID=UPI003D28325F
MHEQNVLERYIRELGDERVHRVAKVSSSDPDALAAAVDETLSALRSDALVVFQAALRHRRVRRVRRLPPPRCATGVGACRTRSSPRKARVTALMQLAAYVDQLDRLGIPRADEVDLIHGDNSVSTHAVDDLLPLFRVRRARLRALIADRAVGRRRGRGRRSRGATTAAICAWSPAGAAPRARSRCWPIATSSWWPACGRCSGPVCAPPGSSPSTTWPRRPRHRRA